LLYHNRKSAFCSLQPQSSSSQPSALCLCHLDCFLPSPAQPTARRLIFDASLHRVASLPSSAVLFVCLLSIIVPLHVHLLEYVPSTLVGVGLLGRSRRRDSVEHLFHSLHLLRRVLSFSVISRRQPRPNNSHAFFLVFHFGSLLLSSTTLPTILLPLCTPRLPSLIIRRGRVVSTKTSLESTLLPLTSTTLLHSYLPSSTPFTQDLSRASPNDSTLSSSPTDPVTTAPSKHCSTVSASRPEDLLLDPVQVQIETVDKTP
jgi:hypothetical protein